MRVGLIADIHGNAIALDVVLAELDAAGVDRIVCFGDVANLGPQPSQVIHRLREREVPTVIGNADIWLVPDHVVGSAPPTSPESIAITRWNREQLTANDLAWLRGLPFDIALPLVDGGMLTGFHAGRNSVDQVIGWNTPDDEIANKDLAATGSIIGVGHTHVQCIRRIGQGLLVNPGSVGLPGTGPGTGDLPVNQNVAWAEYGIIDLTNKGRTISLHRLSLDVEQMVNVARLAKMPHFDWWRHFWAQTDHPAGGL